MSTKKCRTCNLELPLDSYYNNSRNSDGKFSECVSCHKERYSKWLKTPKGKSYSRSKNKERYDKIKEDPDFIKKRKNRDKDYYARNRIKKLNAVKSYQKKKALEEELISLASEDIEKSIQALKLSKSLIDLLYREDYPKSDLDNVLESFKDLK
jgi:hypothetical protein